ncbi:MAG: IS4 family transposase [Pseudonocardiales bacterium]|nr:IS4 family transposase [Pseudonocardiales bacterium]
MTTTLTRTLTVAAGVFAPGHLGELTRYLPFELVDDVLAQTGTMQQRLRALPSRTGVYFVLALGLFPRIGYARVWAKLCAGLAGADMVVPAVSEKALRELRRRLGPAPFKALFDVIAGPLAQPKTPGVCFAGLRTVAFDGLNSLKIPDTERNRCWIGRIWYRLAFAGYPTLRVMCLVETGTRGLLGAVIGGAIGTPGDRDETHLARRLLRLLGPGMLLLADRAFDCATFLAEVDHTGAKLLIRASCSRKPPVSRHLPDGSYLSQLAGLPVRIIEAELTIRGSDGTAIGDHYRLITTLLDDRQFPAARLIRLYHERWEIETAYLALRHTLLAGHVLRSQDRPGIEQEVWALLTLYQLLRTAMVDAIETRPGLDPDRASFTTAIEVARDQLLTTPGIDPDPTTDADQLGAIGHAVLTTLLPARRPRYSNRNVKCPTSRYHARDDGRPALSTNITAIDIAVHTSPLHPAATASTQLRHPFRHRQPAPSKPTTPLVPTRRQLVTAILLSQPRRDWHGFELANKLHIKQHNLRTQLAEWARLGFIRRTGTGTYTLDDPPPNWPPDHLADQLTTRFPGIAATPDGHEKRDQMHHPQQSKDQRPCAPTNAIHNGPAPGTDTPTTC